jgi:NAD(P)-dependent dehydrogenase (short-subunit alcohol dehydrogenase family)
MRTVVTGAAGFVGSHLCTHLLEQGDEVVGIDAMTDFYDAALKETNLAALTAWDSFSLHRVDLTGAPLRVLTSGWLTTGPQVAAFEEEFSHWVGARHAVAVSSCTAALELSLRSLRLPPGAPVLLPTITFCGAVNAILHAGLKPVLMDAEPRTLMPDA